MIKTIPKKKKWTIQSMEFSRLEYWSGYCFSSPGDLPNHGIESRSPSLQGNSFPAEQQGKKLSSRSTQICFRVIAQLSLMFSHSLLVILLHPLLQWIASWFSPFPRLKTTELALTCYLHNAINPQILMTDLYLKISLYHTLHSSSQSLDSLRFGRLLLASSYIPNLPSSIQFHSFYWCQNIFL